MRNPLAQMAAFWITGTLVAFTGVAVTRWLAPAVRHPVGVWVAVTGQLLALGGLFVIALGVRRRLRIAPGVPKDPRL